MISQKIHFFYIFNRCECVVPSLDTSDSGSGSDAVDPAKIDAFFATAADDASESPREVVRGSLTHYIYLPGE
jgi:hypothetical protein